MPPSTEDDRLQHRFDDELADTYLFAWFSPMFELLRRHWQVALVAGIAVYAAERMVERLPWPWIESWWIAILHTFTSALSTTAIAVAAYLLVARREARLYRFDEPNTWQAAMIRAVQVCLTWTAIGVLTMFALGLVGRILAAVLPSFGELGAGALLIVVFYAVILLPVVLFLLSPIWASLAVAGALSTAYAVRSLEGGASAVQSSLGLAFGQRWRVFWPSYVLGLLLIGLFALLEFGLDLEDSSWSLLLDLLRVASVAAGVAMTFVIERVYAPHLGSLEDDDAPDPAPGTVGPATDPGAAAASVAPARSPGSGALPGTAARSRLDPETATAVEIADCVEQDLRANRVLNLGELVDLGLSRDARFFVDRPDPTLALAKRLAQAHRPDLALRLLKPYIKEQRGHHLHLTAALFAAGLLLKDERRLSAAARFLAQIKSLYPTEPMVDQLIRQTEKAQLLAGR